MLRGASLLLSASLCLGQEVCSQTLLGIPDSLGRIDFLGVARIGDSLFAFAPESRYLIGEDLQIHFLGPFPVQRCLVNQSGASEVALLDLGDHYCIYRDSLTSVLPKDSTDFPLTAICSAGQRILLTDGQQVLEAKDGHLRPINVRGHRPDRILAMGERNDTLYVGMENGICELDPVNGKDSLKYSGRLFKYAKGWNRRVRDLIQRVLLEDTLMAMAGTRLWVKPETAWGTVDLFKCVKNSSQYLDLALVGHKLWILRQSMLASYDLGTGESRVYNRFLDPAGQLVQPRNRGLRSLYYDKEKLFVVTDRYSIYVLDVRDERPQLNCKAMYVIVDRSHSMVGAAKQDYSEKYSAVVLDSVNRYLETGYDVIAELSNQREVRGIRDVSELRLLLSDTARGVANFSTQMRRVLTTDSAVRCTRSPNLVLIFKDNMGFRESSAIERREIRLLMRSMAACGMVVRAYIVQDERRETAGDLTKTDSRFCRRMKRCGCLSCHQLPVDVVGFIKDLYDP